MTPLQFHTVIFNEAGNSDKLASLRESNLVRVKSSTGRSLATELRPIGGRGEETEKELER